MISGLLRNNPLILFVAAMISSGVGFWDPLNRGAV